MQEHQDFRPLADLDDYELKNEDQDIRGKSVVGPSGNRLGEVRELLVDKDHDRVAAVRLDDGAVIPVENLERRGDTVLLRGAGGQAQPGGNQEEERIPILQEEMLIGKREVDRGGVRVQSRVLEEPVQADVTLREEHVSVSRRPVDAAAGAYGQADFQERTISMNERAEEAVVAKEARVVEEVVVRKDVGERTERVDDTLRHTEVDVQDDRNARGDRDRT